MKISLTVYTSISYTPYNFENILTLFELFTDMMMFQENGYSGIYYVPIYLGKRTVISYHGSCDINDLIVAWLLKQNIKHQKY